MAFELDPAQPLPRALRAVALDGLREALASLKRGKAVDIHDVRKATKRLRAWLRLVRPLIGRDYVIVNALLRDAARAVAGSRERDVARATLRSVQRSAGLAPAEATAVRAEVFAHLPAESRKHRQRGRRLSAQLFGVSRLYLRRVPLSAVDGKRLEKSLRANRKRCRSAYRRARHRPTPLRLHEWRKQANYLRHQAALLERAMPGAADGKHKLKQLADALGLHHDLHQLSLLLRRIAAPQRDALIAEIRARQQRLEKRALRLGRQLFGQP